MPRETHRNRNYLGIARCDQCNLLGDPPRAVATRINIVDPPNSGSAIAPINLRTRWPRLKSDSHVNSSTTEMIFSLLRSLPSSLMAFLCAVPLEANMNHTACSCTLGILRPNNYFIPTITYLCPCNSPSMFYLVRPWHRVI